MIKLLIITPFAFHDDVGHAGGKILNFNYKNFENTEGIEPSVAYTGDPGKDYKMMKEQYSSIKCFSAIEKKNSLDKAIDWIKFKISYPILKKVNPKYFITNGFIKKRLKQSINKITSAPDVIIVEYTQLILWVEVIKKKFPKAKYIASCHDVTSQLLERKINEINVWNKKNYQKRFESYEMNKLSSFDCIAVLNDKDKELLEKHLEKPIIKIAPYYGTYNCQLKEKKDGVLFWGAMYRSENMDAVKWFVENVWNEFIKHSNGQYRFYIVGGGMKDYFKDYLSDISGVEAVGFVADPSVYFSKAFCTVVPLRLGAGIKIKVLEAMASGLPVLTNDVGIEGIPAIDGKDFFMCRTPNDYVKAMMDLSDNKDKREEIINNAKKCISDNFNLKESIEIYIQNIKSLSLNY